MSCASPKSEPVPRYGATAAISSDAANSKKAPIVRPAAGFTASMLGRFQTRPQTIAANSSAEAVSTVNRCSSGFAMGTD